jgi:hypothetical protein
MEIPEKDIPYLIDAVMVFMHEIDNGNSEDERLPELQDLLIRLMFTAGE